VPPAQPRAATAPRFRADPREGGCLTSAGREGHRRGRLGAAAHGVLRWVRGRMGLCCSAAASWTPSCRRWA